MKLVTYDDGRVGEVVDGQVCELDVPDMRTLLRARAAGRARRARRSRSPTSRCARRSSRRSSSTPRATSASTTRSPRTSTGRTRCCRGSCSSRTSTRSSAPTSRSSTRPTALTNEMDYELELAVVIGKAGKFFSPEEAEDYIAGYLIFNDITARDIQREEMKSGVFSLSKGIDTFCPIGPWIVTPDEVGDPQNLSMELRVNGESRQVLAHEPHVGDDPGDHQPLLADGLLARATSSPPAPCPASPASATTRCRCTSSRATRSSARSSTSACCATRSSRGPRGTPARPPTAARQRLSGAHRRRRDAGRALRGHRAAPPTASVGIPYAQARRFAAPEPAPAWSEVRDATVAGPVAPQPATTARRVQPRAAASGVRELSQPQRV